MLLQRSAHPVESQMLASGKRRLSEWRCATFPMQHCLSELTVDLLSPAEAVGWTLAGLGPECSKEPLPFVSDSEAVLSWGLNQKCFKALFALLAPTSSLLTAPATRMQLSVPFQKEKHEFYREIKNLSLRSNICSKCSQVMAT